MPQTVGYVFGNPPDGRSLEADDLLVDSSVFLGIELELEGVQHLRYTQSFLKQNNWNWINDHSLRGTSCELITQSEDGSPIRGMDVVTALEALTLAVNKVNNDYGTWPLVSVRTSTHVHVDVRDLTAEQISRFILYYVMFEDILMKAEAPERCNNNYCLPVSKSSDLKNTLANLISSDYDMNDVRYAVEQWPKYSGLNVGAVGNLGTLEFRIFPGSYDASKILLWINIILSLRRAAVLKTLDVQEIPEMVSGQGVDKIFEKVFPADIAEHLLKHADYRSLLRGARLIQSLQTQQHSRSPSYGSFAMRDTALSNRFKAFKEKRNS